MRKSRSATIGFFVGAVTLRERRLNRPQLAING